jgi:hypothetical protein
MASPTPFRESNAELGAPEKEDVALPIHRSNGVVVSCWRFTKPEIAEINETGRVWLMFRGETHSPVVVLGRKSQVFQEP